MNVIIKFLRRDQGLLCSTKINTTETSDLLRAHFLAILVGNKVLLARNQK